MKRRVLTDDGKFVDYKGPAPAKGDRPTIDQKIAERSHLDTVAANGGFNPENPVVGGLSKEDTELLKGGKMTLIEVVALAGTRKVVLPKEVATVEDAVKFLLGEKASGGESVSEADKEKVRAGISIPEMRKLLKAANIQLPKEFKKASEIKGFILSSDREEDLDL